MNIYPNTSTSGPFKAMVGALNQTFRGHPRVCDGKEVPGSVAIVTKVKRDYVQVVTHDLVSVEVLDLNHDDFCRLYQPTIVPVRAAAQFILEKLCPVMTVVPPAQQLLEAARIAEETKVARAKTSKGAKAAAGGFAVYGPGPRGKDHTCIMIGRENEHVACIMMYDGMEYYLHVGRIHHQEFDAWFAPSGNYPVEKLAALYLEYALRLGATEEALDVLGKIVHISDKEYEMAVSKKNAAEAGKTTPKGNAKPAAEKPKAAAAKTEKPAAEKPAAEKPAAEKPAKETKTAPAKAEKPAKAAPAAKDTDKKPSAAQRFQDLIMEGKKTDDEIFAIVQKEFGLDDKKRSYVNWYRNHLKKQGKNPPAPK